MKISNILYRYLCILLIGLSGGCETGPARQDVLDEMSATIDESRITNEPARVPAEVSSALIPSISLGISRLPEVDDQQKFDISVNEVPADQFFLSLVDGTRYNVVIHPEVTGNITLNLSHVTIPEVLEAVRDVYGYEFVSTEYGFQVLPGRLQARIYQINFLNVLRSGSSHTIVSSGSLTQGGTTGGTTEAGGDTASTGAQSTLTGTEINTQQPVTAFWQELEQSIRAIVGAGEGRGVVVNPQSGVVVVRALPTELREVETFLEATQLIVQRQVILEAKIIEVRLNDKYQTGINWGALLDSGANTLTAANTGGGTVLVNESGTSDIAGNTGILDPASFAAIQGAAASAFGGVFSLALNLGDFTAFIELLKTQGNVQILSSPRVATLNNQKAVIKVGQDEFFVTDVTNATSTTAVSTQFFPTIELTPFFSGIALDVTPQISEDELVTLHVHPSVSEVTDQQKTVTIGNLTQQLPLALSTIRETDSIVRARSGQVIVIGGLMQNAVEDRDAGTPVLGDIPVIGSLFKHTRKESLKSELVILLKPIVVNDDSVWVNAMSSSSDNLKKMKGQLDQQNWAKEKLYKPEQID